MEGGDFTVGFGWDSYPIYADSTLSEGKKKKKNTF